jgi:RNA polymerase sigma factor (sigma-70 family)
MATRDLKQALDNLRRKLDPARRDGLLTDAQLLARFSAVRDEASFAALVKRHGPMVLGVCRRVLRHHQDAEDAFQATFIVLARKAGSLANGEALGSWLFGVAYRTALEARSAIARRRARERQVEDMPHPEVAPAEAQDWRPLLDHELSRLPEKYRSPVVLCDLECLSRREAARQLRLPEGTLSSRIATARRLLAKRLSRYGLSLSGGALATVLAKEASAAVPAPLAASAVNVAVGQAVAATAVALSREVLKTMLLAKLKLAVGAVMVVAALGAGGVAYQVGSPRFAQAAPESKPPGELEALRKENELLKLNLQVVLEKVRAQVAELRAVKGRVEALSKERGVEARLVAEKELLSGVLIELEAKTVDLEAKTAAAKVRDAVQQVEAALNAFREARNAEAKRRAAEALEQAVKKLREQQNKPVKPNNVERPR